MAGVSSKKQEPAPAAIIVRDPFILLRRAGLLIPHKAENGLAGPHEPWPAGSQGPVYQHGRQWYYRAANKNAHAPYVEEALLNMLLAFSRLIDAINTRVGRLAYWLVLVAVLVSAGNATVRYTLNTSSNAWLEIQWYLFSAVFLLCSGYTLLHNQHVRIDIITGRFSKKTQAWIDIFGTLFFLMPMALAILWLSWPVFVDAYTHKEVSTNAGGLIVWPARLLLPAGFLLLILQGFSELIKRMAFVLGVKPDPSAKDEGPSAEEQLAEEIRKARGETA